MKKMIKMFAFCGAIFAALPITFATGENQTNQMFKPMVATNTTFAFAATINREKISRIADAHIDNAFGIVNVNREVVQALKNWVGKHRQNPLKDAPSEVQEFFLDECGLQDAALDWLVLSMDGYDMLQFDFAEPRFGGISLVIHGDIDLEKMIAAFQKMMRENDDTIFIFQRISIDNGMAGNPIK